MTDRQVRWQVTTLLAFIVAACLLTTHWRDVAAYLPPVWTPGACPISAATPDKLDELIDQLEAAYLAGQLKQRP